MNSEYFSSVENYLNIILLKRVGKISLSVLDDPECLVIDDAWDEFRIQEAENILKSQKIGVNDYWSGQYSVKAYRYWHEFYKRNENHFYKDRHYLHIEFPELNPEYHPSTTNIIVDDFYVNCKNNENANEYTHASKRHIELSKTIYLLEVGCGVGNAAFPLLQYNPNLHVIAIDFASSAINLIKTNNPLYEKYALDERRLDVQLCDISKDDVNFDKLKCNTGLDLILCMYVLSAIPPQNHCEIISKLASYLKPGGKILLRDYGRYDEAQLRFKSNSRIGQHQYVRQDGTLTYYFSKEELLKLAEECIVTKVEPSTNSTNEINNINRIEKQYTLKIIENDYVMRQYANRQQKQARCRVWIQAKFQLIPMPQIE